MEEEDVSMHADVTFLSNPAASAKQAKFFQHTTISRTRRGEVRELILLVLML